MSKETLVIYVNWQYECCGEAFKVGDIISWDATPYEAYSDKILLKEGNKKIKYDYTYEGCPGGLGILTGKVKCIKFLEEIMKTTANNCHILLGYKIKESYNSSKELNEATKESNMLVILEDVEYKLI